jgi:hypothetical protein
MIELAGHESRAVAECFLDHFKQGGAVYRIFWLHCWDTRCPIYDQHVHRAMTFIRANKQVAETSRFTEAARIQCYLNEYLPFVEGFRGIDSRAVDKALWRFGKSLKDGSLPFTRSQSAWSNLDS